VGLDQGRIHPDSRWRPPGRSRFPDRTYGLEPGDWIAARAGIRQFVDLGSGLSARSNTYEVRSAAAPVVRLTETLSGRWEDNSQAESGSPRFLTPDRLAVFVRDSDFVAAEQFWKWSPLAANAEHAEPADGIFVNPVGRREGTGGQSHTVTSFTEKHIPGMTASRRRHRPPMRSHRLRSPLSGGSRTAEGHNLRKYRQLRRDPGQSIQGILKATTTLRARAITNIPRVAQPPALPVEGLPATRRTDPLPRMRACVNHL
jgi:hypothetical protein